MAFMVVNLIPRRATEQAVRQIATEVRGPVIACLARSNPGDIEKADARISSVGDGCGRSGRGSLRRHQGVGVAVQPFTSHTGIAAPLDRVDVDTDQIIPRNFLTRVERTGYGEFLFNDWRRDEEGRANLSFVLNKAPFDVASILVTGRNFGCGSSREHAAWALKDFGFRAIVAPSLADIFRSNSDQNGLLCVELTNEEVERLMALVSASPGRRVTVDLMHLEVRVQEVAEKPGFQASFSMEEHRRQRLLEGLDAIDLTLRHEEAIRAYEQRRGLLPPPDGSGATVPESG